MTVAVDTSTAVALLMSSQLTGRSGASYTAPPRGSSRETVRSELWHAMASKQFRPDRVADGELPVEEHVDSFTLP